MLPRVLCGEVPGFPSGPPQAGPGTGIEGWGSREESPGEVRELTEPRGRPQRQVSGLRLGVAVAAMGYGKPLSSTWEETPMANTTHPPVGAPHLPGQGSGVTQVPTAGPGEPIPKPELLPPCLEMGGGSVWPEDWRVQRRCVWRGLRSQ